MQSYIWRNLYYDFVQKKLMIQLADQIKLELDVLQML